MQFIYSDLSVLNQPVTLPDCLMRDEMAQAAQIDINVVLFNGFFCLHHYQKQRQKINFQAIIHETVMIRFSSLSFFFLPHVLFFHLFYIGCL